MLFIVKEKNFEKVFDNKKAKELRSDLRFFLISNELPTDNSYKGLALMQSLMPPTYTFMMYVDGDKEAKKDYHKYLKSNDDSMVNILNIMLTMADGKIPVIIIGDTEDDVKFPYDLLDFIEDRYDTKWKELKNKDHFELLEKYSPKFDKDEFHKDLKKYRGDISNEILLDKLEEMSKKELKTFILDKMNMSKDKFKDKFGDEPKKKDMIKYVMKNKK